MQEPDTKLEPMTGDKDNLSPHSSKKLRQIADVLGTTIEKLTEPAEPHVLHTDADGTCWLLMRDANGIPIVRCVGPHGENPPVAEERIGPFLAHDTSSPQHQALIAYIERLIVMHLAC